MIQRRLDEFLRPYDAILAPAINTVAGPIEQPFRVWSAGFSSTQLSGASNVAGLPCICLPNGFGASGLPTGLQLVGRAGSEAQLLAMATAYQQRTDWHRRQPPGVE